MNDLKIAQKASMKPIEVIAKQIGIEDFDQYGKYKAKIDAQTNPKGKLILVTAITPTPHGEGKSTITVGLVDGLAALNKKVIGTLREPSMGPVFGLKGGATGGGYSQVVPMEDINLHFTGDIHAITSANNLVSAAIDNHIFQGNKLNIDPKRIVWKRALDINDRSLRNYEIHGKVNYKSDFLITVASELMAIMCLANDYDDFRERLNRTIIAYTMDNKAVYLKDLKLTGPVMAIMKDALKPNLVQTLENNPVLIHGGPFANIAHGCNSVIATQTALSLADYVVTEAGFGSDLGAEKFMNIKMRMSKQEVSAVVLVVTIRALKHHGRDMPSDKPLLQIESGLYNLTQHINNIKNFKVPIIISLNKFENDSKDEIELLRNYCNANNLPFSISEGYLKGSNGMKETAKLIVDHAQESKVDYTYDLKDPIELKIEKVVQKVYGGKGVIFSKKAQEKILEINQGIFNQYPICMAKTPTSLSDVTNKQIKNRHFKVEVADLKINSGAGFIIVYTGKVMTMPGLNKKPAYEAVDLDENNKIIGLF